MPWERLAASAVRLGPTTGANGPTLPECVALSIGALTGDVISRTAGAGQCRRALLGGDVARVIEAVRRLLT